jgi:hypothetical protein
VKAPRSAYAFEPSLPSNVPLPAAVFGRRPAVIVAEQGRKWLAAFRTAIRRYPRELPPPAWNHVQTPADAAAALAEAPQACLVFETTWESAPRDLLQFGEWHAAFPAACLIVVCDRLASDMRAELAAAFREAGAVCVLASPRQVDAVVPLVVRHWQRTLYPMK